MASHQATGECRHGILDAVCWVCTDEIEQRLAEESMLGQYDKLHMHVRELGEAIIESLHVQDAAEWLTRQLERFRRA